MLGGPNRLNDVADLRWRLPETFREKGFGNGLELETGLGEAVGKTNREGAGDFGRADSMSAEDVCECLGVGVLPVAHSFFLCGKIEALVDAAGTACPVDFQWAQQGKGFARSRLKPGEIVWDKEPGRVGEIGNAVGIADEETGDSGHG
jgi:hypothetical protein